jgi:predicted membrane metal-binding protein
MSSMFRELCAEVLAYNEGQGKYNFSHLSFYDRDNAAFDAWQDIRQRIKEALTENPIQGAFLTEMPFKYRLDPLGCFLAFGAACFTWAIPSSVPVYQKLLMGAVWPAVVLVKLFEKLLS